MRPIESEAWVEIIVSDSTIVSLRDTKTAARWKKFKQTAQQ